MSFKLNNLVIKSHKGQLVIGKTNKRGILKSYLDISTPIIELVLKMLKTDKGRYLHHEVVDSETNEVKHYKITCREMTEKEVVLMKQSDEKKSARKNRRIGTLMSFMLGSLGNNNIFLK